MMIHRGEADGICAVLRHACAAPDTATGIASQGQLAYAAMNAVMLPIRRCSRRHLVTLTRRPNTRRHHMRAVRRYRRFGIEPCGLLSHSSFGTTRESARMARAGAVTPRSRSRAEANAAMPRWTNGGRRFRIGLQGPAISSSCDTRRANTLSPAESWRRGRDLGPMLLGLQPRAHLTPSAPAPHST